MYAENYGITRVVDVGTSAGEFKRPAHREALLFTELNATEMGERVPGRPSLIRVLSSKSKSMHKKDQWRVA